MAFTRFEDLVRMRYGAMKHIDELLAGERAAVFTTSCRTTLDFTDDREKLRQAVSKVQFKPLASLCSVHWMGLVEATAQPSGRGYSL